MDDLPKIYDFDPRNLPDDALRAIGLMAMSSAQTEWTVANFIGSVLGVDVAEMVALTAHMSAPLKDQIARTLIELNGADTEIIDEIDDILDEIKTASDARNIVVHNAMMSDPESRIVYSYRESARGSLTVSLKPISIEEIEQDALRIYNAGTALVAFMLKYGLSPHPRTRPLRTGLNRKKAFREKRRKGEG